MDLDHLGKEKLQRHGLPSIESSCQLFLFQSHPGGRGLDG
jgi:hypothetical protein